VPAAQFGVGGDGQVTLLAGGLVPVCAVGHRHLEGSFALLVGVTHDLVAHSPKLLPGGLLMFSTLTSGISRAAGIQGGQVCDAGSRPGLAQLIGCPRRRPGSLNG
jgi:hypothetical protein